MSGVETQRYLDLPLPDPDIPVDAITMTRDPDRSACVLVENALPCDDLLVSPGEDGDTLARRFSVPFADTYRISGTVSLRRTVGRLDAAACPGGRVQQRRAAGRRRRGTDRGARRRPGHDLAPDRGRRDAPGPALQQAPGQRDPGRGQPGRPGVAAHPGAAPRRDTQRRPARWTTRVAASCPTLGRVEVLAADPGVGDGLLRPGPGVRAARPGHQRHQLRRTLAQAAPGAPARRSRAAVAPT